MNKYSIKIDADALANIRDISGWYDIQNAGLGKRFKNSVISQINNLTGNPQIFAIRYKEIRCMLVNKFPYMVHFYINSKTHTVEVLAVISTDRNPKIWEEKIGRNQ
jgi:hypothetical protein